MQQWPSLEIAPHPLAPTFARETNPELLLRHLMQEVSSSSMASTEKLRLLLREAGFVSLWFYLKFIAGFDGPYNLLNTELHVDMANFRQRVATTPGIKAAGLIPRSCYKSTIWSHGANTWELVRNPNLRIGCTSQILDRAQSFVRTSIQTLTENDFHKWLYPEFVKSNRSEVELFLENRTRRFPEPNLQAITAGGSTQGIHVDLFDCDDIVGEDMLNADYVAGAEMARMGNWLYNNLRTLVVSWLESRVMVVGTRYAVDDPYERLMHESREQLGYWTPLLADYPLDETGTWVTYYRPALQDDEEGQPYSINPAAFTVQQILRMLETDPWTAQSQYMNNPIAAGISEWNQYEIRDCRLQWDDLAETYRIHYYDDEGPQQEDLRDCDVILGADPSGGAQKASLKSSRAAVVVLARSSRNLYFVLEADAGYIEPTKFFDWLFRLKKQYAKYTRATYIETQGGFKSFVSILRKEEMLRGEFLNFLGIPALGEKETTIRNLIQPLLAKRILYVKESIRSRLMEEVRIFPSKRLDLLDALKIAVYKSVRPSGADRDEDDDDRPRKHGNWRRQGVNSNTGY